MRNPSSPFTLHPSSPFTLSLLPPFTLHPSPFTLSLLLFSSLILLTSSPLSATPITSLDNQPTTLADHIQPTFTFILTISEQDDLPEAQRLITYLVSEDRPTIVLVALPPNALKAAAMRRAANSYFQSDFSRQHTYYIEAKDHPYPESKTVMVSPGKPDPIATWKTYPTPDSDTDPIPLK